MEHFGGDKICADPVQDIEIDTNNMIIHPKYSYSEHFNDIAIISLNESARLSQNNIKLICLPFMRRFEILPKSMVVIGYGITELSSSSADVLQKVYVKTESNDKCFKQFKNSSLSVKFTLTGLQFCAGDTSDSCKGEDFY
jgi:secreted trypsin-like serine protease